MLHRLTRAEPPALSAHVCAHIRLELRALPVLWAIAALSTCGVGLQTPHSMAGHPSPSETTLKPEPSSFYNQSLAFLGPIMCHLVLTFCPAPIQETHHDLSFLRRRLCSKMSCRNSAQILMCRLRIEEMLWAGCLIWGAFLFGPSRPTGSGRRGRQAII